MQRRAFTLIELAIVLMIVGVVVGGSFKALKMSRERAQLSEIKDYVLAAREAVIGDAINYSGLSDASNFDQNLSPVRPLTVPTNVPKRSLLYIPATELANALDICSKSSTSLSVVDERVSPSRTVSNVAFVLVHEGINKNLQTIDDATTNAPQHEVHIYNPSKKIDDNTAYPNINRSSDEYDDVVKWVTLNELKQKINCSQDSNKIVFITNATLPRDVNGTGYLNGTHVSLLADRGFPFSDDSDVNSKGDSDIDSDEDYLWCIESDGNFDGNFSIDCGGTSNIESPTLNYCNNINNYHQCSRPSLYGVSSLSKPLAGSHSFKLFVSDERKLTNESKVYNIVIDAH